MAVVDLLEVVVVVPHGFFAFVIMRRSATWARLWPGSSARRLPLDLLHQNLGDLVIQAGGSEHRAVAAMLAVFAVAVVLAWA